MTTLETSLGLLWQPLHEVLTRQSSQGDPLLMVVSAFVKRDALERLLSEVGCAENLKLVVRWRPEDLLAGVSDLEIYPYLKARGIPLYASSRLHLKLYVCNSNWALSTSANLTQRGLGYSSPDSWNIEVGSALKLSRQDWMTLYQVVHDSRLVTDEVYARLLRFVDEQRKEKRPVPEFNPFGLPKVFTLASLPATDTPEQLEEFYFAESDQVFEPEFIRRAFHDLANLGIPPDLTRDAFRLKLQTEFVRNEFVQAFVQHVIASKSLRFGAATDWIHHHCEDVPLPYRSEIKEQVRILYDWLAGFISGISWDRPQYSQVIRWQEPQPSD